MAWTDGRDQSWKRRERSRDPGDGPHQRRGQDEWNNQSKDVGGERMERRNLFALIASLSAALLAPACQSNSEPQVASGQRSWNCPMSAEDSRLAGNVDSVDLNRFLNELTKDFERRDWTAISEMTARPLRVWDTKSDSFMKLTNGQVVAEWVATAGQPSVLAALNASDCKSLRYSDVGVGIGNGALWVSEVVDSRGAAALRVVAIYPANKASVSPPK
jgi:hypothetical protein